MIFLPIIVFILIALSEIPELVRQKYWPELIVFSFFLLFAFVLSLLTTINVDIPSPERTILHVFKDILHLSYK